MKLYENSRSWVCLVAITCLLAAESPTIGDEPALPPISQFAPLELLQKQIATYADAIQADLAGDEYGSDQSSRVEKDAATISVLALMLGHHDQENRLKKGAKSVIALANQLSEQAGQKEAAQATLAKLQKALATPANDEAVTWEPTANLALLMKQVPIVNNSLRRGVTSKRFTRTLEKSAGDATTLAAIAQASLIDTNYCSDDEDKQQWQQICADMRDASAAVLQAVNDKDQEKATAGLEKIVASCDACHHKFRD